jgi:hypothetical protein
LKRGCQVATHSLQPSSRTNTEDQHMSLVLFEANRVLTAFATCLFLAVSLA